MTKSNLHDKKICLPIPIANMLKVNDKECIENQWAGQISKPNQNAVYLNLLHFCPSKPSFVFALLFQLSINVSIGFFKCFASVRRTV